MIEGKKISMGGKVYTIPPLNIKLFRQHKDAISQLTSVEEVKKLSNFEYIEMALPVVVDDLKRNYPELTLEKLETDLAVSDMAPVVAAMFAASGVYKENVEGVVDPKAVAPSETSTGTG